MDIGEFVRCAPKRLEITFQHLAMQTVVLLCQPKHNKPAHIDTSLKDSALLERAPALAAAAQQVIRFVDGGKDDDAAPPTGA